MKSRFFTLVIFASILIPCSISCYKIHPASRFLNSFSLDETIKRMNVRQIDPFLSSRSSTASAGDPSPYRREFDLEIIIKEGKADSFDEQGFLSELEKKIKQEAIDSGVKVYGGGNADRDSFHINYRDGNHFGGIEVIGVRTEKSKYRVWCVIRELAPKDS